TTSSCPANSSRLSSKTCVRRRPENDSPKSRSLAAGSLVVRTSAAAGPASRWLAVSIVRHDVELGDPPQTVSQPLWPRLRREPHHALHAVPCPHPSLKNWAWRLAART